MDEGNVEMPSWGELECARICQLILQANSGVAQQILESRTDLLELLTNQQVEEPDDLGITPQFLTIYYDKPDMLCYLHARGLNFGKPCDPMGFGTPMFYAVSLGKVRLVKLLDDLGYSVAAPCDSMENMPYFHATRIIDRDMRDLVRRLLDKKINARILVEKNLSRIICRKRYLKERNKIIFAQKICRGYVARQLLKNLRIYKQLGVTEEEAKAFDDSDSEKEEEQRKSGVSRPTAAAAAQLEEFDDEED